MNGRPSEVGHARLIPRTFRLTQAENVNLEQQSADRGFGNPSAYLRWLVQEDASASAQARVDRKRRRPWDD